jgi:2-keto-4-pentenoate hydratase
MVDTHRDAAAWLVQQHASRRPFEPFAAKFGIESMPAAYTVQRDYLALRAPARGLARAGYKIGLTSPAMQAMCHHDAPVAGTVFRDGLHASGARLHAGSYVHLGIEFEIAVRLARDLRPGDAPATLAEVTDAVDGVAPAIEIVDDRGCDYATLDAFSLVADNAWNAGIVLGEFRVEWPELADVVGQVFVDDDSRVRHEGRGRDALGHPLLAVTWLANHLATQDEHLRAGEVVMTGSIVTTKFPVAPCRYRFAVSGLGAVELMLLA